MNNETFVYMGGDMVVPQDVVRVRVHPSVTVIPEKAFYERRRLEEVELSDGLLEIGSYAFDMGWSERSALKRMRIPSSVKVLGSYSFARCFQLEEVVLCEGLLEIGMWAFHSCKALTSIDIPSTVTSIGSYAFYRCDKLEGMKVPSSVSVISACVFSDCTMLGDVELCEGLLEIGEFAFVRCTSLKRIKLPSTVSSIDHSFKQCEKLAKVELNEGLVEIGEHAFYGCYSLESINIPSTVKTIGSWAFAHVPLKNLTLPDNIERIGNHAFWNWNEAFAIARLPSLITTISGSMCRSKELLSMELPESIERVDNEGFDSSMVLRNLALPSNAEIGFDVFKDCLDLKQLGSERNIINILKHRFDNLPIHKMLYYQSFGQGRIMRSQFDDPSIKQQDTLGMTPLHRLACSTMHNIELYKILIENHPESLITKDKWGAIPLLYAIWRDAGKEIRKLLVKSYLTIFPNYKFDWTMMMETLARANVDGDILQHLHNIQINSFPDQCIDWDMIIEKAITHSDSDHPNYYITTETFRQLVIRRIAKRVRAMQNKDEKYIKPLINGMADVVLGEVDDNTQGRRNFLTHVHSELEVWEDKYNRWMEALTSIELVLWKNKMDDCCGQQNRTRRSKKMRLDDSAMRKQCRIRCGAETNIVIEHVLPYLDIL